MSILQRISELERRVANIITIGVISDVDYEKSLVQVTAGELITGWLPWLTRRAGKDTDYWAPEVNEQVLVMSENGDIELGVVLPALYRDMSPALDKRETVHRTKYQDGSVIEYDKESHKYLIDIKEDSAAIEIVSAGTLTIKTAKAINVETSADAVVTAANNVEAKGKQIILNDGTPMQGVVRGCDICMITGKPHPLSSKTVFAGG